MIDDVAGLPERLDEVGGGVSVVFDDENPHGRPIPVLRKFASAPDT